MATPTIDQLKKQILTEKTNQESLSGLTSTSKVSVFNIWAYVIAVCIWTIYAAWDIFTVEMDDKIRNQKLYSLLWFRNSALEYRHGHPLDDATGKYTGEGYTDQEIEDAQIVARAAVIEIEINNRKHLFIKLAKEVGGTLVKLDEAEQDGVRNYFSRIKPAGTKIITFSDAPDELKLEVTFYYDPLIFDQNGVRIDGKDNTPVQKAISDYLANLKFNGEFILAELVDILQGIEGCADREVYINSASANYLDPATYQPIESSYIANSGYMEIATEAPGLSIEFIPKIVKL
jgi:hypothetical protein